MPVTNSNTGAFSVGLDCQLVIIGAGALGRVDLSNVTGFECDPEFADVKVDRLDGIQLFGRLPKGWRGGFDLERGDGSADLLQNALELSWYGTGRVTTGIVYQYITEVNGSQTAYSYPGAVIWLERAGRWQGDATVRQRVGMWALRRVPVGSR